MDDCDYEFKFVLVGNPGVGKSSILRCFLDEQFLEQKNPTIGVEFRPCTLRLDSKILRLTVWDTAGEARYQSIVPQYYRGASGIIIVYSIADKESFQSVKSWYQSASEHARGSTRTLLVGNKSDLSDTERKVSRDEARLLADECGMLWIETSARLDSNIKAAFDVLARDCMLNTTPALAASGSMTGSFFLDGRVETVSQKSCCSGWL